jgi:hypothetical protein
LTIPFIGEAVINFASPERGHLVESTGTMENVRYLFYIVWIFGLILHLTTLVFSILGLVKTRFPAFLFWIVASVLNILASSMNQLTAYLKTADPIFHIIYGGTFIFTSILYMIGTALLVMRFIELSGKSNGKA